MKIRMMTISGLALALVLLFAVNILSGSVLHSARLDLTENRLHTLSSGTRNILGNLDEPITIRLYLSDRLATRLPEISSYANRVKEMLYEFERASNGQVTLHVIDPEPFSEEEDRAVGYGLRGLPVNDGQDTFYMGVVGTNSVDDEEVIPFLSTRREAFLEYDLTRLVHSLANAKQTVIGLVTALPIDGAGPRAALRGLTAPPWMVYDQVKELSQVQNIGTDFTEVPEGIDVLLIVHPKRLSPATLYAIDQYVLRGGRALVFVDPNSEADQGQIPGMPMMAVTKSSNLDPLLRAWGVKYDDTKVVGDAALAAKVRMERDGRIVTFDYPVWLQLQSEQLDGNDIVTAELGNLAFGTPGFLEPIEGATTTVTPLVQTTDQATLFTQDQVQIGNDPRDLLKNYRPVGHPLMLAARITGPVESAYPDGPPAPPKKPEGEASRSATPESAAPKHEHLAKSEEDINVVVVADTDLLSDRFWVEVQQFLGNRIAIPTAANGAFVVTALDNLAGSNDLISVRNRGSFFRPFDRINELRREAEMAFQSKEQQLTDRLQETEAKLLELENNKQGDDALILSDAQQKEIVNFRQQRLAVRKELRDVRHELRKSIEGLETRLKFINIGLVPIMIGVGGVLIGLWRMHRRKRTVERPASA